MQKMKIFETALKDFVKNDVNAKLRELFEEELPLVQEQNITSGAVDLSRYDSAQVICAILPETQNIEEGNIDGLMIENGFTISFIFKKSKYDDLINQMYSYADAFRVALVENSDLSQNGMDVALGETKFFYDAGNLPQQMTAIEISITLKCEEVYI